MSYLDLHTHTNRSDGHYDPDTLIQMAEEAGISILAITDHNEVAYDLDALQARHPNVKLLYGCEFSAAYVTESGREVELHIVGVDFDPNHPKIRAVLAQNKIDRKPYIDAILAALAKWEIYIGTYEELCEKYPETKHLGRKAIGTEMAKQGYVSDVDAAFDLYIGAFGERRAYVKNPARYVDLETCVDAILSAGGTPILAHLSYYQLTYMEELMLLSYFRKLTGPAGAMEVYYSKYTEEEQQELLRLSRGCKLLPSAGSDFHGQCERETLKYHYPAELHAAMVEARQR